MYQRAGRQAGVVHDAKPLERSFLPQRLAATKAGHSYSSNQSSFLPPVSKSAYLVNLFVSVSSCQQDHGKPVRKQLSLLALAPAPTLQADTDSSPRLAGIHSRHGSSNTNPSI
jgi:hypothetical protein